MRKILLTLLLLPLILTSAIAQNEFGITFQGKDILPTEGEAEVLFLAEDGSKVVSEFIETCRDIKTGRFIKCSKVGNGGFINRKQERRCRDSETGRFIKCPK